MEKREYPAPGYRSYASGTLCHVGYYGFSWSSSVTGSSAYRLNFYNGGGNPNDYGYRAYGFQVRCLQE